MLGVGGNIDAQFLNHSLGHRAVGSGTLNGERATVAKQCAARGAELVTLCMSSEVIMIFEDEDSSLRACCLAEKVRGRETTEASAHDYQVVDFAGINRLAGMLPK